MLFRSYHLKLHEAGPLYGVGTESDIFGFIIEVAGIAKHVVDAGAFGIEIDHTEGVAAEKRAVVECFPDQAVPCGRKVQVGNGVQSVEIARPDRVAYLGFSRVLLRYYFIVYRSVEITVITQCILCYERACFGVDGTDKDRSCRKGVEYPS